ncbi:uncharacterized protein LAESUDRAFT_722112 [Laetiporus sulphureus 93-53]|uniref:Uncharacterized protein n=1 Tax=Laetiporus sulphureus 93-53 TaxID=1314785 RepID=A0A165G7Z3_9APHY|nr:uncharacterized protein LAESUDRAFT_722112 [Laetiporus sulphureus 93-53]KZT09954.1 hypothetical protein LAESUDRAFT_722112 [Laetiporus sulphureus 93-53]
MLDCGSIAVAIVQRQVTVVQSIRQHGLRERWVDVLTFRPLGERIFLVSDVPSARIPTTAILTIYPSEDDPRAPTKGILELPPKAFSEYLELSGRMQKKYEDMYNTWLTRSST